MRPCKAGEITAAYSICEICPAGTYSLEGNQTECTPCPSNYANCNGKDDVDIKSGYYRN